MNRTSPENKEIDPRNTLGKAANTSEGYGRHCTRFPTVAATTAGAANYELVRLIQQNSDLQRFVAELLIENQRLREHAIQSRAK